MLAANGSPDREACEILGHQTHRNKAECGHEGTPAVQVGTQGRMSAEGHQMESEGGGGTGW